MILGRIACLVLLCAGLAGCSSMPTLWPAAAPVAEVAAPGPSAAPAPSAPPALAKPAVAGPLAGNFGAALSAADRQTAFDAELAALDAGARKSWRGRAGVFGFVAPEAESGGCRAYVETLYMAGRPSQAHAQGCRQADGTWRISG